MSQKSVLIIEDEENLNNILNNKLIKEGFKTFCALNGRVGLEKAFKEKPDLILLDIIMPYMDGMSVLQELRNDSWGKNVPVIILTNLSDAEKVQEAVKHQAYDYLIKSDWKLEDVVAKIKQKLRLI